MTDTNDKFADNSLPMPSRNADFNQPISIHTIHSFGAYFDWGQKSIGFGQLSISVKDGKVSADTEGMGRDWTRRALHAVVEKILEQAFDEDGKPK